MWYPGGVKRHVASVAVIINIPTPEVPKDIDFSDFKTLDALELAGAVNTFCEEPLTDKFIQTYNLVRSLRNKIAHLGQADTIFHPDELLRILVFQYAELWKGRAWLRD